MTMSDPAARTTRDTHRRAATTGLAVPAAGIVVFMAKAGDEMVAVTTLAPQHAGD